MPHGTENVGQVAVTLVVLVLACNSPFAVQHWVDEVGVVGMLPQRLTMWCFILLQHVDARTVSLTVGRIELKHLWDLSPEKLPLTSFSGSLTLPGLRGSKQKGRGLYPFVCFCPSCLELATWYRLPLLGQAAPRVQRGKVKQCRVIAGNPYAVQTRADGYGGNDRRRSPCFHAQLLPLPGVTGRDLPSLDMVWQSTGLRNIAECPANVPAEDHGLPGSNAPGAIGCPK
mmetsp:Transcript_7385/g.20684  ORF Transcript_7385/g.20684 Transcript_7385/m.20684 type:complete len:228 (+) Transcript_7385:1660-2343(+)